MILFLRDDCGPIEIIKRSLWSQNSKNLQFTASAHQGMKDAQVGDRELQTTTDRNKGKRTTTMTIQVGPGRLKAARIGWNEKNYLVGSSKLNRDRNQS